MRAGEINIYMYTIDTWVERKYREGRGVHSLFEIQCMKQVSTDGTSPYNFMYEKLYLFLPVSARILLHCSPAFICPPQATNCSATAGISQILNWKTLKLFAVVLWGQNVNYKCSETKDSGKYFNIKEDSVSEQCRIIRHKEVGDLCRPHRTCS